MNRTDEQKGAATSLSNLLCIEACPGSGKTTVLTDRVARYINSDGINPLRIGVVTYTNSAANIMRERVEKKIDPDKFPNAISARSGVFGHCGTLHALIFAIIGVEHKARGYKPPSILPEEAATNLLDDVASELCYKGSAKKLSDAYERTKYTSLTGRLEKEELVIARYRRLLATEGFYDYNSLLVEGHRLIREGHEDTKAAIASITELFVDEFQDAATIDIQIYLDWPARTKTFVGDRNQTIFSFRGADTMAIDRLPSTFDRHHLTLNFRCPQEIVDAANRLISHNISCTDDRVWEMMSAVPTLFGPVMTIEGTSQEDLRSGVVHLLKAEQAEYATRDREIAVLVRTNKIAEAYRLQLQQAGFQVESEEPVVNARDWPLAKLWLSFMACPTNDLILKLLMNAAMMPLDKFNAAQAAGKPVNHVLAFCPGNSPVLPLKALFNIARPFNVAGSCVAYIVEKYGDLTPGGVLSALRGEANLVPAKRTPGVAVLTAHSAKGREWDTVVVTELIEGIWPLGSCAKVPEELKEERRLAYVAMTRAKCRLHLGFCNSVISPWGRNPEPATRSRFITEALA